MRTIWQVEQDAFCRAVLAHHFPDAERFEDVCEVGAANLEPVDLICGGFPCQDLSVAGKGAGIDAERSGLWAEFARIIGELRPRYVVVENVPALLRNEWLGRVLGDLAAVGYDAEWDCLPASAFGAPHRRDRIWLVAYPGGEGPQRAGLAEQGGRPELGRRSGSGEVADAARNAEAGAASPTGSERQRVGPGGERSGASGAAVDEGRSVHDADRRRHRPSQRPLRAGGDGAQRPGWWGAEPGVGRVANGVPHRVDRLAALGNALVPQIAEWIGGRILDYEQG